MDTTLMTVIGFSIIFLATALGSATVWFFKGEVSEKVNTAFLGFASGIMIAASVWSLIIPSIEGASDWGKWSFVPAVAGFLAGGLFLVLIDKIVPHFHCGTCEDEGPKSSLNKSAKMFLAVTIHNIPEGLAVGFVFGAAAAVGEYAAFVSALALAVGMAIQNFPEGAIISMPLRSEGMGKPKAFFYGILSGAVEPVGALLTILAAELVIAYLPYLLSFAAGAMIYVVVEELIPEMSSGKHSNIGTVMFAAGFTVMMALDVALG